jgi:glycosyltransferase involved in cell wall biosynthesis
LKKSIKALILTDGSFDHASSRTRAIQYFGLFKENLDMDILWIPRIGIKKEKSFYKYLISPIAKRYFFIKQIIYILFRRFDFVYIQRYFIKSFLIKELKRKNAIIFFDFDDAIYVDKTGENSNRKKTEVIFRHSNHIVVSSKELEAHCNLTGFFNVSVITTPVDPERFFVHSARHKKTLVIGWIGSPYTTHFLKIIERVFIELSHKQIFKLMLVGANPTFKIESINMEVIPWNYDMEPELINQMDIGIMPLPDEEYARGKGGYKLLQYMSAGIPVVASPIGINSEIVRHGQNGFLAKNKEEWIKFISILLEDAELRETLGESGRKDVLQKYSRTHCFARLSELIKKETEWNSENS